MIRINLLGTPRTKKGKRAAPTVPSGEMGMLAMAVVVLVIIAVTAAVNGLYYMRLQQQAEKIQSDLKKAEVDYARLTQVKMRYEEREKQREAYKKRVDVIDQLRASQAGPVNLLSMLGDTVTGTDAVWLNTMKDDGTNIELKGVALTTHAVANLMHNLQGTGYFSQVDIKTALQDDKFKDMQAYNFELTCQKKQTAAPKESAAQTPAKPQPKKS